MTKRTKTIGYQTGGSSANRIAPQQPYTGDGKTKRNIFDGVKLVFKKVTGQ
jgi:hypothetical protein